MGQKQSNRSDGVCVMEIIICSRALSNVWCLVRARVKNESRGTQTSTQHNQNRISDRPREPRVMIASSLFLRLPPAASQTYFVVISERICLIAAATSNQSNVQVCCERRFGINFSPPLYFNPIIKCELLTSTHLMRYFLVGCFTFCDG